MIGVLIKIVNFNDIDFKKVGARIAKARKTFNLPQEKAAECAFITTQFRSLIESGRNEPV